ncbi:MAG: hypothetical protein LUE27_07955 [Clostridia bacterium]|nr:hypothetical protein [Clostridia bacterium]
MKNFFAKKTWASYVAIGCAVLAIVAMALSIVSNNLGGSVKSDYLVSGIGGVIAMDIIAFLLAVCAFVVDGMFEGKLFSILVDVMKIAAAALLLGSLAIMVSTRGDMMGYIWFSDLEGSEVAASSLTIAVVSWVFYALAIVADAVSLGVTACVKKAPKNDSAA